MLEIVSYRGNKYAITWPYRCVKMLTIEEPKLMSDINNILETLVEAKAAIEENPALKSEIESLKAQLASLMDEHIHLQDVHTDLYTQHDEACIRVTELEASLEAARFQELAANKKLNKLAEIVGEALHEALPPVEPVAEPVAEVVDTASDVGVVTKPQAETVSSEAVESTPVESTEPKATEPTVNPTSQPTSEPVVGSGTSPGSDEPKGEVTPFVTNPIAPVQFGPSQPYLGKPYSFKPNSVSWPEWLDGGGQRPWWLNEDVLNQIQTASS